MAYGLKSKYFHSFRKAADHLVACDTDYDLIFRTVPGFFLAKIFGKQHSFHQLMGASVSLFTHCNINNAFHHTIFVTMVNWLAYTKLTEQRKLHYVTPLATRVQYHWNFYQKPNRTSSPRRLKAGHYSYKTTMIASFEAKNKTQSHSHSNTYTSGGRDR